MRPAGSVAPPPKQFNFAQHLIELNAARKTKIAYIDDQGELSYAELALAVRRFASALRGLDVRREERVLLLLLDSTDWPVAFLGSLYAGVVPTINTLLTRTTMHTLSAFANAGRFRVSGAGAEIEPALTKVHMRCGQ